MQLFADTDLFVFLTTVAQILIFGPLQLRRNLKPLPKTLDIRPVAPESLSEAQQKYLKSYDEKLAKINYWPNATYCAANYGRNLLRSYVNPTEPVRCVLMIVEVSVNVNGMKSTNQSSTLEFFTYFADGTVLSTRNMRLKSVFEELPYREIQECPRVSDPAELRHRHLERLQTINRGPKPAANDVTAVFKEFQETHQRFCTYQFERGNLRPDPTGKWYFMTSKVHWRGIVNHLNPFAQRFAFSKFLPAALSGIAIPVLASMYVPPVAAHIANTGGLDPMLTTNLAMAGSYALAGAIVGLLLQKADFLWTFIFTYLGVGSIMGFHSPQWPYSTIAAIVSHAVAQSQKRSFFRSKTPAAVSLSAKPAAVGK